MASTAEGGQYMTQVVGIMEVGAPFVSIAEGT